MCLNRFTCRRAKTLHFIDFNFICKYNKFDFHISFQIIGDNLPNGLADSSTPTRYLQEIKGCIDYIYRLFYKYYKEICS